jgi:hypothetical protein
MSASGQGRLLTPGPQVQQYLGKPTHEGHSWWSLECHLLTAQVFLALARGAVSSHAAVLNQSGIGSMAAAGRCT